MDVKIDQMVYKGSGLARLDEGGIIFVPFTLPDEIVSIDDVYERNGVQTALPKKIVSASADRIVPKCPYYGICGGCQYQHINYSAQLIIKKTILSEQLERVGSLKNIEENQFLASSRDYNYRNHVQFHFDPEGKTGFQKALSHDVIAVDECLIAEESINRLLKQSNLSLAQGLNGYQ